jgi:hypothetical protein
MAEGGPVDQICDLGIPAELFRHICFKCRRDYIISSDYAEIESFPVHALYLFGACPTVIVDYV